MLDSDGTLVTVAGHHPVLDSGGNEIVVPKATRGKVRIDAGGEVRAGGLSFGRINVVEFTDNNQLKKVGGNMLAATAGKPVAIAANLLPGSTEGSAVDPTATMVSMIQVSRAYQMNATMVGLADSTLGRAVNDIARLK